MSMSDAEAVKFGLLVMYVEDMDDPGKTKPNSEARIAQAGWETIAYLTAKDALMPTRQSLLTGQRKHMIPGDVVVFYGFLARNDSPESVRRRDSRHERDRRMIIDADFLPVPNPREPGTKVEQGFWGIYESMNLVGLDGETVIDKVAADGIANIVGDGDVTVASHSLGAALAT